MQIFMMLNRSINQMISTVVIIVAVIIIPAFNGGELCIWSKTNNKKYKPASFEVGFLFSMGLQQ